MKIYASIMNEHGAEILREFKAGALKQRRRVVKADGRDLLLWTGSCQRLPKKSSLAKHAKKAGVKRAVVLCPPTVHHLYVVNLERRGDTMKETASKAFRVVER